MTKKIDISTQEGLDLLKQKAKFYGYYAENLMVKSLIEEIELLRANTPENVHLTINEARKKVGW